MQKPTGKGAVLPGLPAKTSLPEHILCSHIILCKLYQLWSEGYTEEDPILFLIAELCLFPVAGDGPASSSPAAGFHVINTRQLLLVNPWINTSPRGWSPWSWDSCLWASHGVFYPNLTSHWCIGAWNKASRLIFNPPFSSQACLDTFFPPLIFHEIQASKEEERVQCICSPLTLTNSTEKLC